METGRAADSEGFLNEAPSACSQKRKKLTKNCAGFSWRYNDVLPCKRPTLPTLCNGSSAQSN
ncbi:MAG: hypothetical protein PeribacterD2_0911 [Candidatus Peribacter riflensis]|nr:MAG: hypothetical protein PeribacterD2_0911 [Candidatus Peribacter riflensis]